MSSLTPTKTVYEAITYHPNTEDKEATIKKFVAGIEIQKKVPGFVGIVLEGNKREVPGESVRLIEWESVEVHMEGFRGSPEFAEFKKVREGSTVGDSEMAHYRFFKPLPTIPPVVEWVTIQLKQDTKFEDYYREWDKALDGVRKAVGCTGIEVGQQVEDPTKLLQIQGWETLENHTIDFKEKQADVKQVMEVLTEVVNKYVEGGWKGCKGVHVLKTAPGHGA